MGNLYISKLPEVKTVTHMPPVRDPKRSAMSDLLPGIIHDLEYAAFNLCEKTDCDIPPGVIESTCPEVTLLLAIRRLKQVAG